ncbi:hypothetical protein C0J52_21231 [Blattella germanica]|nr:hypothetical protein C0J52_21231 [Blattella germanica]
MFMRSRVEVCGRYFLSSGLSSSFNWCNTLNELIIMVGNRPQFSISHRVFIYDSYVRTESARTVTRLFKKNFPDVRVPHRRTVHFIVNKIRETGSLVNKRRRRRRKVLTEETLNDIGKLLEKSTKTSFNDLSQQTGLSYGSVQRAMKLQMSSTLEEVWTEATKNLSKAAVDEWWTKILEKYGEDERNYHNIHHLEEKIEHFKTVKGVLGNPDAVALAIIFHYYEYDPKAMDCVEKNCEHFNKFADDSGIPKESVLRSKVVELLQAAATHSTDAHKNEGQYGSEDLHFFLDIDMAVLGSDPELYSEYIAKIQQEYAFLPETMYKSLRLKVSYFYWILTI